MCAGADAEALPMSSTNQLPVCITHRQGVTECSVLSTLIPRCIFVNLVTLIPRCMSGEHL